MSTASTLAPGVEVADRAAWLADRRNSVGASEAAAVAGLDPHRTALDVYCDKLGLVEGPPETEAMRLGLLLEPLVAQLYEERTGVEIPRRQVYLRREGLPMHATLDGLRADGRVVELKTVGTRNRAYLDRLGEEGTDEVPEAWICQVQHQMACAGAEVADVAVLVGGQEFRVYTVEARPRFQALLEAAVLDFWGRVERREPPPVEGPVPTHLLLALHPGADGQVELGMEAGRLVAEWEALKAEAKELTGRADECRRRLLELMGGAALGTLPDGRTLARKVVEVAEAVVTRKAYRYADLRIKGKARTDDGQE